MYVSAAVTVEARASVNDVQRKVARVAEAATVAAVSLQASPAFALVRTERREKNLEEAGVVYMVHVIYIYIYVHGAVK